MGGTRMNDEKEGELAKETFLKLGWDIYDERDVEVLSEAFKSHGKAMFEKGMNTCAEMSTHLGLLPINSVGMRKIVDEANRLKERVAELEKELSDFKKFHDEEFFGWEKLTSNLKVKLSQAEATERELRENWLEDMQEWSVEKANLMDVAGKLFKSLELMLEDAVELRVIKARDLGEERDKRINATYYEDIEEAKLALAEWDGIKEGGK